MSEFLDKVSDKVEKIRLEAWVRISAGGLDQTLECDFPKIFGKNWHMKMGGFLTAEHPELLALAFNHELESRARWSTDYRVVTENEAPNEVNNFDFWLFDHEEGSKPSSGKKAGVFAAGCASHSTDKKAPRVLVVKVRSENFAVTGVFGAFVDLSDARGNSKWSVKNGVATLKIAASDKNIIVPFCGNIGDIRPGSKFISDTEYDPMNLRRPDRREFSLQNALLHALKED